MFNIIQNHNPDILDCFAKLSNDEVFTPAKYANAILDMLPQELWTNSEARFLDPCCKSGVFLREILHRLEIGLINEIPDKSERLNHILKNQIYGIALTEITAMITRRTLYSCKDANGNRSITTAFDNKDGNIFYSEAEHEWDVNDKCIHCPANRSTAESVDNSETHAYDFTHTTNIEGITDMKFDVIVGNPPYQLDVPGSTAAAPIYHNFIKQAMQLKPKYISMIVPARWYAGGKGLDSFRAEMLSDKKIAQLHDIPNADDVFPGVEIKGGICYFLWDIDHDGDCTVYNYKNGKLINQDNRPLDARNVFIRNNKNVSILNKVSEKTTKSFSELVSSRKPFGMAANFTKNGKHSMTFSKQSPIKLYIRNKKHVYINEEHITKNIEWLNQYKVLIAKASEGGSLPNKILGKPLLSEPGTCCSETYLIIDANNKTTAENIRKYISTKFFRFMVSLVKNTQNSTHKSYTFVPMQDFNKVWTDEELYQKYNLTLEERNLIEANIKPMELSK